MVHRLQTRNQRSLEKRQAKRSQSLEGKVVLLVGNDTALLQTLISQCIHKGADVALVCHHLSRETLRWVKALVESAGRHFLLIEEATTQPVSAERLIQAVVNGLGRLDLFIDLSAYGQTLHPAEEQHLTAEQKPGWWLARAALHEIVYAP